MASVNLIKRFRMWRFNRRQSHLKEDNIAVFGYLRRTRGGATVPEILHQLNRIQHYPISETRVIQTLHRLQHLELVTDIWRHVEGKPEPGWYWVCTVKVRKP